MPDAPLLDEFVRGSLHQYLAAVDDVDALDRLAETATVDAVDDAGSVGIVRGLTDTGDTVEAVIRHVLQAGFAAVGSDVAIEPNGGSLLVCVVLQVDGIANLTLGKLNGDVGIGCTNSEVGGYNVFISGAVGALLGVGDVTDDGALHPNLLTYAAVEVVKVGCGIRLFEGAFALDVVEVEAGLGCEVVRRFGSFHGDHGVAIAHAGDITFSVDGCHLFVGRAVRLLAIAQCAELVGLQFVVGDDNDGVVCPSGFGILQVGEDFDVVG